MELYRRSEDEALSWFQGEIAGLRSGRVKTELIESIPVEAYGSITPLKGLASITVSDARTLVISPWDRNTIPEIERVLTESDLGINPVVDGTIIRIIFATLTEEVRDRTIKILHKKAEEARVRLRQGRDDALRILKEEKEKGEIPEDDFFNDRKELDHMISVSNDTIARTVDQKEVEIRSL